MPGPGPATRPGLLSLPTANSCRSALGRDRGPSQERGQEGPDQQGDKSSHPAEDQPETEAAVATHGPPAAANATRERRAHERQTAEGRGEQRVRRAVTDERVGRHRPGPTASACAATAIAIPPSNEPAFSGARTTGSNDTGGAFGNGRSHPDSAGSGTPPTTSLQRHSRRLVAAIATPDEPAGYAAKKPSAAPGSSRMHPNTVAVPMWKLRLAGV